MYFHYNYFITIRYNLYLLEAFNKYIILPYCKLFYGIFYKLTSRLLHTPIAWWQYDCQWGMSRGLQLAGIALLWFVGVNID